MPPVLLFFLGLGAAIVAVGAMTPEPPVDEMDEWTEFLLEHTELTR